jgi:hypothetical protein
VNLRVPLLLVLLVLASPARAHPLLPASLSLHEQRPGTYQLRFRRPARLTELLSLQLPARCTRSRSATALELDQAVDSALLVCPFSLAGQRLGIAGLARAELEAVVQLEHLNGELARALLSASRDSFVVPARSTWSDVLGEYIALGAHHLFTGLDHLLFSAGVLLLGVGARALWLLSAFSFGHSLTLIWLALSARPLPEKPIELGIALSLIGLALAVLSRARELPERQARAQLGAALCFAVGLLHGLGFASGLRQLSLPAHALWPALLGFNLGVELAQLALVALLAPALWLCARRGPHTLAGLRVAAAYATGGVAALWCIERTLAWLG